MAAAAGTDAEIMITYTDESDEEFDMPVECGASDASHTVPDLLDGESSRPKKRLKTVVEGRLKPLIVKSYSEYLKPLHEQKLAGCQRNYSTAH
jgi:hypothetical protein